MVIQKAPGGSIKVMTADDHALVRDGVKFAVDAEPDMKVIAEATTGQEAIDLFLQHRPDVTLMDLQMPGVSGLDALIAIKSRCPEARVIVITTYSGDVQASRAIKAGAAGYLLKGTMRNELVDTIRRVHVGQRRFGFEVSASLAEYVNAEILSAREVEVLKHVAAGSSNKRIGVGLGVSEETVKGHMRNILSKLEANDRTHAVTIALRRGFLVG